MANTSFAMSCMGKWETLVVVFSYVIRRTWQAPKLIDSEVKNKPTGVDECGVGFDGNLVSCMLSMIQGFQQILGSQAPISKSHGNLPNTGKISLLGTF